MLKTYRFLATAIVLVFLVGPSIASDYEFSGAGGFQMSFSSPDMKFLDDKLAIVSPGFGKVETPIYSFGGMGYGRVSDRIRIGGFGYSGESVTSGTFSNPANPTGAKIRQDVSVSLSGGGFLAEAILFNPFKRVEIAGDLGLIFGATGIRIDQYGNNPTWDDLMNSLNPTNIGNRETFSIEMVQGFFGLEPGIGVKYYITSFMAFEAKVGYRLIFGMEDWQMRDVKILDMPDVDFSAPSYGFRVLFGG